MTPSLRRVLPVLTTLLLLAVAASWSAPPASGEPQEEPPGLARAIAAQDRNTPQLMARAGVVGTGVGLGASGDWVVVVYTDRRGPLSLPSHVDNVPTEVRYSGRVDAFAPPAPTANFTFSCTGLECTFDGTSSDTRGQTTYSWQFGDGSNGSGQTVSHTYAADGTYDVTLTVNDKGGSDSQTQSVTVASSGGTGTDCHTTGSTTERCKRPVPIGVSVGHPNITAGTIGSRVRDGSGQVFILSNNHVLADANQASLGDSALQPGPADGGADPADQIGTLADYDPISFNSTSNTNTIDAAIASTTASEVDNSTPAEGYGAPSATTTSATVGMAVQKYGRTTGHTFGTVAAINVTVDVCYEGFITCQTWARFVDQVAVEDGTFSAGGDSGSLIVTDDSNKNPVALLFAGSDTNTFANPISAVLTRFGVTIDVGATGNPPTADAGGPYAGTEDTAVAFDGSGSSDPDADSLAYLWDFGDGTTGSGVAPSHTYLWGGTFTVSLQVSDGNGNSDTATTSVTVTEVNDPPVADPGGPYAGQVDSAIDFDGSGSYDFDNLDGTPDNDQVLSYDWDFGDGAVGTGVAASHAYAAAGDYTVTLTVGDGTTSDVASTTASVTDAPAGVTVTGITPDTMQAGATLDVTITGSGFVAGAAVLFENGDGPAPSASNVVVAADGNSLTATVTAKSGGPPRERLWDVVVENDDLSSGALVGGLTITP